MADGSAAEQSDMTADWERRRREEEEFLATNRMPDLCSKAVSGELWPSPLL